MTVARRDTAGALCVRAVPHPVFIFINVSSCVTQRTVQQSPETAAGTSPPRSSVKESAFSFIHHTNVKSLANLWYVKAPCQVGGQHAQYLYLVKTLLCGYL